MLGAPLLIMVVDDVLERAHNLKSLIEFLDVPEVRVATPGGWDTHVGERRLAAVFLSRDLPRDELHRVIEDVGRHDPNVPIVLVDAGAGDRATE